MLGVGCGFDTKGEGKIRMKSNVNSMPCFSYVIEDSREGFTDSMYALISAYLDPNVKGFPIFNYSQIRKAGTLIDGFGGRASGPKPLKDVHEMINAMFSSRIKEGKTSVDSRVITDLMNMLGSCVAAGGTRRTAELAIGNPFDVEFLDLKNYEKNPERKEYGRFSNNSIAAELGMDYSSHVERTINNGEPGFLWLENIRAYGRMSESPNYKDSEAKGCNPCLMEGELILTRGGPKAIETLIPNEDEVWTSEGWSKVKKVFNNGVAPVYEFKTNAGSIRLTNSHKILENGKKIEIGKADGLDVLSGPTKKRVNHAPEFVADGLVLGYGYKKEIRSGKKLSLLCIGKNDQDYFSSEVSFLIEAKSYEGHFSHKIDTTVNGDELKKPPERAIPKRYFSAKFDERCSLLRGLFSANGTISCADNSKRVVLKTSSPYMVKDTQYLLSSVGIRSYVTTNDSKEVKSSNGTYTCKRSWDINITSDRGIFYQQIGFLQKYKMDRLESILPSGIKTRPNKATYTIEEKTLLGDFNVYDIEVDNASHTYFLSGFNVSNCCEQTLESKETCNLVEIFPPNINSREEFLDVIKYAYLYGKSVTLAKTHLPETNQVQLRNRRIGLSLSGLAMFKEKEGIREVRRWMEDGYDRVQYYDRIYSRWLCIPQSVKTTSIKPSGSISLVAGTTAGVHYPINKYYLKNMRINIFSPLLEWAKKSGYRVAPEIKYKENKNGAFIPYESDDTFVVSFPVKFEGEIRSRSEISIWEQMEFVELAQGFWADNQVSVTVTFLESEEGSIKNVLETFERKIKNVSFIRNYDDAPYKQMPEEKITEEEYEEYVSNIRKVNMGDYLTEDAEGESGCANDTCTLI